MVYQDFYFELVDDGHKISPRDYLESTLRPIPGTGKAAAAKNEVVIYSYDRRLMYLPSFAFCVIYGELNFGTLKVQ